MNKLFKTLCFCILFFSLNSQAFAAFILSGTRVIYMGGAKNASFDVTNSSDRTYGGQVWIDNTNQGEGVYMVPSPPFFKIAPKGKQVIRVINVDTSLPTDKESLFWLNVQEIPPKISEKGSEGNVLAIAMNTRIKLLYRPKAILKGRQAAENKVVLEQRDGETWIKNPTPYYLAISGVKKNGVKIKLSDKVSELIGSFAPFSEVPLGLNIGSKITIEAINDWGGVQSYDIK